ncbi:MAG: hypothetical protein WCD79_02085 [Chthoniobacteraceae bacterium]
MNRIIIFGFIGFCMASCATHHREEKNASPSAPLFYGRYESISSRDQDEILDVAERKIAERMPGAVIENVKVFNSKEVDVTFTKETTATTDSFVFEKTGGHWQ